MANLRYLAIAKKNFKYFDQRQNRKTFLGDKTYYISSLLKKTSCKNKSFVLKNSPSVLQFVATLNNTAWWYFELFRNSLLQKRQSNPRARVWNVKDKKMVLR